MYIPIYVWGIREREGLGPVYRGLLCNGDDCVGFFTLLFFVNVEEGLWIMRKG